MQGTFSSALGGHGAATGRPSIKTGEGTPNERTWTFTFDVPQMLANMETLCEEEARGLLAEKLKAIPEKEVPGSWGERKAEELLSQHAKNMQDRACAPGGAFFTQTFGKGDGPPPIRGGLLTALASIRICHPQAQLADVVRLMAEKPQELMLILDQMGKEVAAAAQGIAAAASRSPQPT